MFAHRIYKRLDIAYNGHKIHEFLLERMAYPQWHNNQPFISGPNICVELNRLYNYWNVANQIEYSLRYFMKPHTIHVFGSDVDNLDNPSLLVRTWLNAKEDSNNVLVTMESMKSPIGGSNELRYMEAINNRSWQPDNWNDIANASALHQTLTQTNRPYEGCWEVSITGEYYI